MVRCPKCNKELESGTKFCGACGAQILETSSCLNGEEKTAPVQKCETDIAGNNKIPESFNEHSTQKKNIFRSFPKKAVIFGGIGVVVLVAIILLFIKFSGSGNKDNFSLYLKDNKIVYTNHSNNKSLELSTHWLNGENVSNGATLEAYTNTGSYFAYNNEKNRIFFPDQIGNMAKGITLYYRDLNKPKSEAIKIDSDVIMYAVNSAGDQVIYVKGSDRILYVHNLTDKEKISSGVTSFSVADDCKKVGYLTDENAYYLWYADKEGVQLASDITSLEYVSTDLSTIYYIKDGCLYKQIEGETDNEKIVSDASNIIAIYSTGEVYYTKTGSVTYNLWDYVEDDMADSDATLTEPEYPEYPLPPLEPYWWDYDTDEQFKAAEEQYETDYRAYDEACNQISVDYDEAYDAYMQKEERDCLREQLQGATMELTEYSLYYFDGTKECMITDALIDGGKITHNKDKNPVAIMQIYKKGEVKKTKLSETPSSDGITSSITEALYTHSDMYLAVGSNLSLIEQTKADNFAITADASCIYFLDDAAQDGHVNLYQMTIDEGKPNSPKMFDSDVSDQKIRFISNKPVYFKDINPLDKKGDLYIDANQIDYEVSINSVSFVNDSVMYYTDWDAIKEYGMLKIFQEGTKTTIAEDVHDFNITSEGKIVYLCNYSHSDHLGSLCLYNNGKIKQIDHDVTALIPVSKDEIKGKVDDK